jgi:hypothetical protein
LPAETANRMIPQQETQAIRSAGFDSSNESNRAATFRSILINGDVDACDAKIIAYATGNPRYVELQNFTDIRPNIHREIEHFFAVYMDLEGKQTKVLGWKDRDAAHAVIQSSHKRFNQMYASK